MSTPRTIAFHTLGCKLNYSETSAIGLQFKEAGYTEVPFEEIADIYVINTCSVTDFADRKCRQIVRRALHKNPQAFVVVTGCYAQLKPDEIAAIRGVDLVLGAAEKFRMPELIQSFSLAKGNPMVMAGAIQEVRHFESSYSFGDRTRSFLKVQDGCDYKCSFCTIPLARGKSRSDSIEHVLRKAAEIGEKGVQEIVLTGVNLGDFGNGTEIIEGRQIKREGLFIDLIRALEEEDNVPRFRISSIEPNLLTDEIISFVAGSRKFMPHFHVPLQSGNNKQLTEMRRRYTREQYSDRMERIRAEIPHACIGVDVIVGFPGETDEDFAETYRYIQELPVSYLHVFTFSERDNTLADSMSGIVPMQIRKQRNEMLRILSEKKRMAFQRDHLGSTREVLVEESGRQGLWHGFTDNYIQVEFASPDPERNFQNQRVSVRLERIHAEGHVSGVFKHADPAYGRPEQVSPAGVAAD